MSWTPIKLIEPSPGTFELFRRLEDSTNRALARSPDMSDPSHHAAEPARDDSGRYARETLCHCCGKPVRDYCSDDGVLNHPSNPSDHGLVLCERVRCGKRVAGLDAPQRLALYVAQRAENDLAMKEGRKATSVKL